MLLRGQAHGDRGNTTGLSNDVVLRARNGDKDAFAELYCAYEPRLTRYCNSRLRNATEADDAVSESFLRALTKLEGLGKDVPFFPWLQVICRNVCTDMQRRHLRDQRVSRIRVASDANPEDIVVSAIGADHARAAISHLSRREQEVFALRSSQGLSSAEISHMIDMSPSAIDRSVYRTRQYLRSELQSVLSAAFIGGAFICHSKVIKWGSFVSHKVRAVVHHLLLQELPPAGRAIAVLTFAGAAAGGTAVAMSHADRGDPGGVIGFATARSTVHPNNLVRSGPIPRLGGAKPGSTNTTNDGPIAVGGSSSADSGGPALSPGDGTIALGTSSGVEANASSTLGISGAAASTVSGVGTTTKHATQAVGRTVAATAGAATSAVNAVSQIAGETLGQALPPLAPPASSSITSQGSTTTVAPTTTTTTNPVSDLVNGVTHSIFGGGTTH